MPFLAILILCVILVGCFFWWYQSYESSVGPVVVAIIAVLAIGGYLVNDYTQTETRTIVVEGKDRGGDDGSYRVYTDGDTLAVEDILFSFNSRRTNSADVFGDIRVCHRYRVTVRGWEFGLLSAMPNIVTVDEDLGRVEGCEPTTQ